MAKKKKKQTKERMGSGAPAAKRILGLHEETRYAVVAVVFFVLGIFFLLASLGKAGVAGDFVYAKLSYTIGVGHFLLPALSFALAASYFRSIKTNIAAANILGAVLFLISGLGLIDLSLADGGVVGAFITSPLVKLFDVTGSAVVLFAVFAISLLILANTHPAAAFKKWRERHSEKLAAKETKKQSAAIEEIKIAEPAPAPEPAAKNPQPETSTAQQEPPPEKKSLLPFRKKKSDLIQTLSYAGGDYIPPPLSIFSRDSGKPGVGDIKANANIIKRTLQNFGIDVAMDEISIGPSVTRYALKPAEGVRLSKILGLQKNLELALAAHPVRIEAPIPGKALVGIEVPNSAKTTVGLGTLLSSTEYQESTQSLTMAIGRDIEGRALFYNLSKMPHLLIAGATGAGKSITIHALINSLLFRNSPERLRLVLIDPKRVELTLYNGIPHLLTPVLTDAKKAILALKWLVGEMERRYNILEGHAVRDISSYHSTILAPALARNLSHNPRLTVGQVPDGSTDDLPDTMPYIVVIIDELADIMSAYPRELEAGIVRLAQMSRAVGIHLILSTQRPSVNVITGLIKANIPGRIALQVSSQIDSRTILDGSGAEKLLGAGDMLFLAGDRAKPTRIQSAFISEDEVKKVAGFLKKNGEFDPLFDMAIDLAGPVGSGNGDVFGDTDEDDDELFEEARETVIRAQKASTSYLQRKLRLGYARAARLMDLLEERGVIGPGEGAKPREVLIPKPDATEDDEGDE